MSKSENSTPQKDEHISIDIFSPLPSSNGFWYYLVCIDRFSGWPTTVPLIDITAPNVASVLISDWISLYGVPLRITADLGREFESSVFREITKLLCIKHLKTTAYHPQAKGIIERWHRIRNKCLEFSTSTNSIRKRSTVKSDIGFSAADMVFGSSLRLPEHFSSHQNLTQTKESSYRRFVKLFRPTTTKRHGTQRSFMKPALNDCKSWSCKNTIGVQLQGSLRSSDEAR